MCTGPVALPLWPLLSRASTRRHEACALPVLCRREQCVWSGGLERGVEVVFEQRANLEEPRGSSEPRLLALCVLAGRLLFLMSPSTPLLLIAYSTYEPTLHRSVGHFLALLMLTRLL